jgi:hypothetical protein
VSWRAGGGVVGWSALPPRGVPVAQPTAAGSAWRFAPAVNLGAAHPTYMPFRGVPAAFKRTIVVSSVPGTRGAGRLQTVAPSAMPRIPIQPHAGTPIASRPWARVAVTPRRPVQMGAQPAYAPAGMRRPAAGGTAASAGFPVGHTYYGPATVGRRYAQPTPARSFAPQSTYRAAAPPPAFHPAPRPFAPPAHFAPPVTHFAPPVTHFAPPPVTHYAPPPAPHFSAPSAPVMSHPIGGGGGGVRSFGGGRRR